MNYLFDSSAIFRLSQQEKVDMLMGEETLSLAKYELGNIVWKEHYLHNKISLPEALQLLSILYKVLDGMEIVDENKNEKDILSVAANLKITFYDASYLYYAKKNGSRFISGDERLLKKAEGFLSCLNVSELL